jgi:hypothetical protein
MGKRGLSTHPHPALPLKGRENRERSLKGRENRKRSLKGRKNRERLRPKEPKSTGVLPLQGGGRRGMGLWEQER